MPKTKINEKKQPLKPPIQNRICRNAGNCPNKCSYKQGFLEDDDVRHKFTCTHV